MITQAVLTIGVLPTHALSAGAAYRLYAWLLKQLPPEEASWLHGEHKGFSQSLRYNKEQDVYQWQVNILNEETEALLSPVFAQMQKILIENQAFAVLQREVRKIPMEALLSHGMNANRATLRFYTPTAFRQNGRYTIFPQERLLLQSLVNRWNDTFPACSLTIGDVFAALLPGIHIIDYRLQTERFILKNVRIPGFCGTCVTEARLAPPLLELWNTLLSFANYAGMGIKTGLGMGGTEIRFHGKKEVSSANSGV